HPRFGRHGLDITSEQMIDMVTATLGGEIEVETVDGPVKMKIPAGTQPGTVFKINGHGVPYRAGEKRGNHLVAVGVEIPRRLTPKQKRLLEDLADS
ncbi:molecular chaperone DnaJ, partial [Candidatus Microgenomates bacterium]|nr:molecular chaperone DnaJ [Candidatus Microgenomates bacterium]